MQDEFLTLFESAKALTTYIDKEDVFDKAAAGGCSGMDYHLSETFIDLIINTRKAIKEVENELEASDTDSEKKMLSREGCVRLFEAVQELTTHIDKERAFDKVNDMGPVGVETYQSDNFIELIENTNKAIQAVESNFEASE